MADPLLGVGGARAALEVATPRGAAALSGASRAADAGGAGSDDARAYAMAAHELAVTFLTELMATMRRTIPDSGLLPRSPERDVLEGAFDRSVAEALSHGDPLGIERQLGAGRPDPAAAPAGEGATQAGPSSLKLLEQPADTLGRRPPLRRRGGGREGQNDEGR